MPIEATPPSLPPTPTGPAILAERVALLDRYLRIRTLSHAFGADVVAEVQTFWRTLGLEFTPLSPEDGAGTPALYAEVAGTLPGPTVLLYGHYDVQPPGDLSAWRWAGQPCDPWSPRLFLDDHEVAANALGAVDLYRALLVGRGSADNKGQHLANVLGVLDARAAGALCGTVKVLLDGEEEHGSPNLAAICMRHRDLLRADLLLGSDGPKAAGGPPTLVLGCRGLLGVEVRAENGRGGSVHSGNYGNIVPNPVLPLARLLTTLGACARGVARQRPAFREAALAAFGDNPARPAWEPFLLPTTNVNGIFSEGATPGAMRTIIPGWAVATIDVRLTPDTPPDKVYAALAAAVAQPNTGGQGVTLTLRKTAEVPSSFTAPDRPEVAAIVAAGRRFWGMEPAVLPLLGGTLPNYIFTGLLGLPAFWLPGAQPDNRQHDVNEHLEIGHFLRQADWYRAALDAVAAVRGFGVSREEE